MTGQWAVVMKDWREMYEERESGRQFHRWEKRE